MGDNEVERLKALTLDMLCGAGGAWHSFAEIEDDFRVCDGDVDVDALETAIDELLDEGKIEHEERHCKDEYRWMPPQQGDSLADKVKRLEAENERLRALLDGDRREIVALVERQREPAPSDSAAAERSVTMGLDEGTWAVSLQSTPDWFIVLYRGKSEHDADWIADGVRHIVERILTDHVGRLRDDVERLRARDAKLIADLKAVDAWTGDGDVETLDLLARRLWKQGIDAEGVEANGAAYVARSLLQDIDRLEAMNQRLNAECLALAADAQHALDERDRLRAEQAADRAATRALVEALPKCSEDCDAVATRLEHCSGGGGICDAHRCNVGHLGLMQKHVEFDHAAPLRALQARMATWPSEGDRRDAEEADAPAEATFLGMQCVAQCSSGPATAPRDVVLVGRCAGRTASEDVATWPGYLHSDDVKRRREEFAKHCDRLGVRVATTSRYVGEFGDIDEPSVGDVEGYGARR